MRIGLVCPYSLDIPGGVQNHVKDLAEALIGLGHDVSVLAPTEDGRVAAAVRRPRRPRGPGALQRVGGPGVASAPSSRPGCGGGCARASSTCCTCTSPPRRASRCSRCGPRSARWWPPSTPPTCARGRCRPRRRSCARPWRRSPPGSRCREYARDTLVHHIGGEPVVIPNGVYVDRFADAQAARGVAGRRRHAVPSWAASTSRARASRCSSTRSPGSPRDRPGLRLLVVGGGDVDGARDRVPAGLRDQVTFLGPGHRRGEGRRAAHRRRLRRAEHRRRELRHRAGRGDGRRRRGAGQRHPRLPPGPRRGGVRRAVPQRGRRRPGAAGWPALLRRPGPPGRCARPRPQAVRRYDWSAVAGQDPAGLRDGDRVRARSVR